VGNIGSKELEGHGGPTAFSGIPVSWCGMAQTWFPGEIAGVRSRGSQILSLFEALGKIYATHWLATVIAVNQSLGLCHQNRFPRAQYLMNMMNAPHSGLLVIRRNDERTSDPDPKILVALLYRIPDFSIKTFSSGIFQPCLIG
jgi:hypothetical protein